MAAGRAALAANSGPTFHLGKGMHPVMEAAMKPKGASRLCPVCEDTGLLLEEFCPLCDGFGKRGSERLERIRGGSGRGNLLVRRLVRTGKTSLSKEERRQVDAFLRAWPSGLARRLHCDQRRSGSPSRAALDASTTGTAEPEQTRKRCAAPRQ